MDRYDFGFLTFRRGRRHWDPRIGTMDSIRKEREHVNGRVFLFFQAIHRQHQLRLIFRFPFDEDESILGEHAVQFSTFLQLYSMRLDLTSKYGEIFVYVDALIDVKSDMVERQTPDNSKSLVLIDAKIRSSLTRTLERIVLTDSVNRNTSFEQSCLNCCTSSRRSAISLRKSHLLCSILEFVSLNICCIRESRSSSVST